MRWTFLLCVVLLFAVCEAKKGHKHHKKDGPHDDQTDRRVHGETKMTGKMVHLGHGHHKHKKGWLHLKKVLNCNCPSGQICVNGKVTGKPICVKRHFLKEGERLFRRFHHEKMEHLKLQQDRPARPHTSSLSRSGNFQRPHGMHISVHTKHSKKHHNNANEKHTDSVIGANHSWNHMKSSVKHVKKTCSHEDFREMRQRLTGWFRLLHAQEKEHHHDQHPKSHHHKKHHHHHHHLSVKKELREHHEGKCKCLKSVMWQMHHLDQDKNHHLNQSELNEIENNNREPCLRPFLNSCDVNKDGKMSRNEWCCCFAEVLPPCFQSLRKVQAELQSNPEAYVPRCDKEGYFEKQQCHGNSYDTRTCWCVDLNGNEVPKTRSRVRAHCGKIDVLGHRKN